jgi:pilus assembly protein Flp/PilA
MIYVWQQDAQKVGLVHMEMRRAAKRNRTTPPGEFFVLQVRRSRNLYFAHSRAWPFSPPFRSLLRLPPPTKECAMLKLLRTAAQYRPFQSEKGVTAIEYGLIAALIAVAIIVAITLVGTNLGLLFTSIAGKV